ncbi:tRNA pseudouridine synthase 1 [Massospora cicadina]|nr:tRNA pseudouridine synthase 1 [Massospora cicadina]
MQPLKQLNGEVVTCETKATNKVTEKQATETKRDKIYYPTSKQRREYFNANKRARRDGTQSTPETKERGEPSAPRLPKKKVALLLGFSGKGYSGMVVNPTAEKTIEADLFSALCQAGAISKDNSDSMNKVSFMRAARTDKGYIKTRRAFHAKNCCSSRIYEYLLPTYSLAPCSPPPENLDKSNLPAPTPAEMEAKHAFRVGAEKLALLREATGMYVGTKNFHNFTIRRNFKEQASNRYIIDFTVSDPFLEEGIEWVSLKVHGQSFMLHQIRKMVAMVVMLVRSETPLSVLSHAFKEPKMKIPMVPGLGLLLERPIFDSFNAKLGKSEVTYDPIDFSPVQEEMDRFRKEFIYSTIVQTEKTSYTHVDYFPEYYQYLNPEGTIPDYHSDLPIGTSEESEPGSDDEK